MNVDLLIVILLGVSTLALVFSKTHVAFVTLALCAGSVMATNIGSSLTSFLNQQIGNSTIPAYTIVTLVLLSFPPLIIGYRFRRSQKGGGRFLQQLIPAFALSLLFVLFVFDALPASARATLEEESLFYDQIALLRGWLVLFAVFTALFDVLMQHAGPPRPYKKRKKE